MDILNIKRISILYFKEVKMLSRRFSISFKISQKTYLVLKNLSQLDDQPVSVLLRRLILEEAERKGLDHDLLKNFDENNKQEPNLVTKNSNN